MSNLELLSCGSGRCLLYLVWNECYMYLSSILEEQLFVGRYVLYLLVLG